MNCNQTHTIRTQEDADALSSGDVIRGSIILAPSLAGDVDIRGPQTISGNVTNQDCDESRCLTPANSSLRSFTCNASHINGIHLIGLDDLEEISLPQFIKMSVFSLQNLPKLRKITSGVENGPIKLLSLINLPQLRQVNENGTVAYLGNVFHAQANPGPRQAYGRAVIDNTAIQKLNITPVGYFPSVSVENAGGIRNVTVDYGGEKVHGSIDIHEDGEAVVEVAIRETKPPASLYMSLSGVKSFSGGNATHDTFLTSYFVATNNSLETLPLPSSSMRHLNISNNSLLKTIEFPSGFHHASLSEVIIASNPMLRLQSTNDTSTSTFYNGRMPKWPWPTNNITNLTLCGQFDNEFLQGPQALGVFPRRPQG